MKKKTDMERYMEEQAHFFQDEELKLRERVEKQTDQEVEALLAKEGEAYKRLVRDTADMLVKNRNIDKSIAKELAETLILKHLRENIRKKERRESGVAGNSSQRPALAETKNRWPAG